jgi:hypothetical protein
MKLFGRDPALLFQAIAILLSLLFTFGLPLTPEWQGIVNGLIMTGWGVATAIVVAKDKIVPAVTAFAQVVFLLVAAFGYHLADTQQFMILTLVGLLFAFFTRTQVIAPINAAGQRVVDSVVVSRGTNMVVEPVNPANPPSGV